MRPFMDEDFLLSTPTAKHLYHDFAEHMPIFDYHCHLSPKEIAEDIQFRNVGYLFLGGDHYKWRGMSACGVDDKYIRGDASDWEKFLAYAKVMPRLLGNPLYHWTHLELKRVFGITEPLNEKTAPAIWEKANALLATKEFSARNIIKRFGVKLVCTTDDPIDDLHWHREIAASGYEVKVLPAFRPDKAVNADRAGFAEYIAKLSEVSGVKIQTTADVIAALDKRVEFFHENGARVSDHGLDTLPFVEVDMAKADACLKAGLAGEKVCPECLEHYRTALLIALGEMYHRHGWVQQYHMNALRNNNARMFKKYGPDTGFDSINDELCATKLAGLLNAQEEKGVLPKTILYSLNPAANHVLAAMAGNFQSGECAGKIQFGSARWFLDQRDGMVEQIKTLAAVGVLSNFVGMLTDSRSFVSYPRHEYFRRILYNVIGEWVENGEYPNDDEALEQIVKGICFENAEKYFGIEL